MPIKSASKTDSQEKKAPAKTDSQEKKGLPEIPDDVFSSGGTGYADVLKDRFADFCFALLVVLLVAGYICMRLEIDPLSTGQTLDEHPVAKKALAAALAVVLGSLARKSPCASELMDRTMGMAITLKDMARGHAADKTQ